MAARRSSRGAGTPLGTLAGRSTAGSDGERVGVAEIQRSRLLAGAAGEIDERGYARASVAHITAKARVSRRTFYDLFNNREACLAAILDEAVALAERELHAASLQGRPWRERVRMGLWTILWFLEREPVLARVCVVETLRGGPSVLERRERLLARLASAIEDGQHESAARAAGCTRLTAEGLVGAAHAILYARLVRRDPEPLTALLGELTAMIVLPYQGSAAARRELARPTPPPLRPREAARTPHATSPSAAGSEHSASSEYSSASSDPLDGLRMRLTYRTVRVLEGIRAHPRASNRQVGEHAGIADQGQVSKLLQRLARLGLAANQGEGAHTKGEPNAWTLTSRGEQLTERLHISTGHQSEPAQ
jgi:AcrR family transcriptional regulator